MRVHVALKMKLVESTVFEFSQPVAPSAFERKDTGEPESVPAETPVLPMGSSSIAPGLSVAVC